MKQPSNQKREFASLFVLIAANLVPIAGVVRWHWQVTDVLFLYWFENILVGAFYILRILLTDPDSIPPKRNGELLSDGDIWISKLLFAGGYLFIFGFALQAFDQAQLGPMVMLIAVKIVIEVGLHQTERQWAMVPDGK